MKNHQNGFSLIGIFKAFKVSVRGLFVLARAEVNVILEFVLGITAISLGFLLNISKNEWMVILIMVFLVIFAELINTAIEKIMDFIELEYNEKVRDIKDLSAGAVFLIVILSIIIGLIIFGPKIFDLFV